MKSAKVFCRREDCRYNIEMDKKVYPKRGRQRFYVPLPGDYFDRCCGAEEILIEDDWGCTTFNLKEEDDNS